jgi:hypothetical protein
MMIDARGTRVLRGSFDGPIQLFLGLIRAYTLARFVASGTPVII